MIFSNLLAFSQTKQTWYSPESIQQFNYYRFFSNKNFFGATAGFQLSSNEYLINYLSKKASPGFNSGFIELFYNFSLNENQKWNLICKAHVREGSDINYRSSYPYESVKFINLSFIHVGKARSLQVIKEGGIKYIILSTDKLTDVYGVFGLAHKVKIGSKNLRIASKLEGHWLSFMDKNNNLYNLRGDNVIQKVDQTRFVIETSTFITKSFNIKIGHQFFTEYYSSANEFYNKRNEIRSIFQMELSKYVTIEGQKEYSYLF